MGDCRGDVTLYDVLARLEESADETIGARGLYRRQGEDSFFYLWFVERGVKFGEVAWLIFEALPIQVELPRGRGA